jgi:hypothetical protein
MLFLKSLFCNRTKQSHANINFFSGNLSLKTRRNLYSDRKPCLQGPEVTRIADKHFLLRGVQVPDVSLERAHVRVELSALLTRVLESVVDALLMAAQVALVRGLVAAPVARIFHP